MLIRTLDRGLGRSRWARGSILASLLLPCLPWGCTRQEPPEPVAAKDTTVEYLRFVEEAGGRARLETAILRYQDGEGRIVDIVGAVHIGDADYYRTLNQVFHSYGAVLYEMVKPAGESPVAEERAGRGRMSWIGVMQRAMKQTLDLEFQLDAVDYAAPNFVHADLDLDSFLRLQDESGENIFVLLMSAMARMAAENPESLQEQNAQQLALVMAMFAPDRAYSLKYTLGKQFGDLEKLAAGIEDAESGRESVLVGKRNAACIQVLERELEAGKDRLCIFYGSAHIPDLERRILALGFEKKRRQWVTAWNIVP